MRCPKCGFNSFDHNLLCPKCRKDLTAARKLLNLSVPIPGAVDFFKTAAGRAVFPEPFLAEEVEVFPEPAATDMAETMESPPAAPREAEADDIEPIDELDEIEPDDDEIEPEDDEIEPEDDEIEPDDEAIEPVDEEMESDDEEIEPADESGAFADQLAQVTVLPADDEEIEIELDEFDELDELEPETPAGGPDAELTAAPPIAETALAQIKSSLTATGDLAADDEIELEPEPEPAPASATAELLEAEPEEFAAEIPAAETLTAGLEELEAPESLDPPAASEIIDVAAIPEAEALTDETAIALDDDFLGGDLDGLPSLEDDFDLEN